MAKDLNQCNFIGRIGQEPIIKYMPNGKAVLNFSIGCNDDYKDGATGETVKQTNWIDLVVYGKLAEVISKYCGKGSKIFVSGKLTKRKWQDKNSGADRYTTEIIVNEMQMLDSQRNEERTSRKEAGDGYQAPTGDDFDDDIPF